MARLSTNGCSQVVPSCPKTVLATSSATSVSTPSAGFFGPALLVSSWLTALSPALSESSDVARRTVSISAAVPPRAPLGVIARARAMEWGEQTTLPGSSATAAKKAPLKDEMTRMPSGRACGEAAARAAWDLATSPEPPTDPQAPSAGVARAAPASAMTPRSIRRDTKAWSSRDSAGSTAPVLMTHNGKRAGGGKEPRRTLFVPRSRGNTDVVWNRPTRRPSSILSAGPAEGLSRRRAVGQMDTELEHEGRRTAVVLIAVGGAAVAALLAMLWLFNSATGSPLKSVVAVATPTTTAALSGETITASATTTVVPPTPTWVGPTATATIAPPELPTMTAPVPGQTADPDPNAPPPPVAPAPPPVAPAPPPVAPAPPPVAGPTPPQQPPAPSVSNVSLGCKRNGKNVTARLAFTTTTKVEVTLTAGGDVGHTSAGPGTVALSASGRGDPVCSAMIGTQAVGPVAAS